MDSGRAARLAALEWLASSSALEIACRYKTAAHTSAEDLVHQARLRVVNFPAERWAKVRNGGGFAHQVLTNLAIDAYRAGRTQTRLQDYMETRREQEERLDRQNGPAWVEAAEYRADIRAARRRVRAAETVACEKHSAGCPEGRSLLAIADVVLAEWEESVEGGEVRELRELVRSAAFSVLGRPSNKRVSRLYACVEYILWATFAQDASTRLVLGLPVPVQLAAPEGPVAERLTRRLARTYRELLATADCPARARPRLERWLAEFDS